MVPGEAEAPWSLVPVDGREPGPVGGALLPVPRGLPWNRPCSLTLCPLVQVP